MPMVSVWSRPNGLPMAKHLLPDHEVAGRRRSGAASRVLAGPASDAQDRKVLVGGATPTHPGRPTPSWSAKRHPHPALTLGDDVEVGDDVAVAVPHEAAAAALRDLHDVHGEEVAAQRHRGDVGDGAGGVAEHLDVAPLAVGEPGRQRYRRRQRLGGAPAALSRPPPGPIPGPANRRGRARTGRRRTRLRAG